MWLKKERHYDITSKFKEHTKSFCSFVKKTLKGFFLLLVFMHFWSSLFWWKRLISFFSFLYRRVSIIRGRVITMSGQGIIGVRVSVDRTRDATNYGFTLTRPGGWWVTISLYTILCSWVVYLVFYKQCKIF